MIVVSKLITYITYTYAQIMCSPEWWLLKKLLSLKYLEGDIGLQLILLQFAVYSILVFELYQSTNSVIKISDVVIVFLLFLLDDLEVASLSSLSTAAWFPVSQSAVLLLFSAAVAVVASSLRRRLSMSKGVMKERLPFELIDACHKIKTKIWIFFKTSKNMQRNAVLVKYIQIYNAVKLSREQSTE